MRISDWSSDVCSSDLQDHGGEQEQKHEPHRLLVTSDPGVGGFALPAPNSVHAFLIDGGEKIETAARPRTQDVGKLIRHQRLGDGLFGAVVEPEPDSSENGELAPLSLDINGFDCAIYRSEEHTSELQSLMRISYAVFCLQKKTN